MQNRDISSIEFHNILQHVEKYRKPNVDIRNQAKTKARQLTKEQWEELLEQGRKEDKEVYDKLQILQVSKVSMPFKAWSPSNLQHLILWSIKTIKLA